MAGTYTVELKGPGLDLSREIDQAAAFQIIGIVMGLQAATTAGLSNAGTTSDTSRSDSPTVGEFLQTVSARTNAKRIAAIALYLKEHTAQHALRRDEIGSWFQRAGETPPKNPTRDLQKALAKKWVAEDVSNAGSFFITSTGSEYLRSQGKSASSGGAAARSAGRRRRRSRSNDSGADNEAAGTAKRRPRSATASGKGPLDWVRELMTDRWLSEDRTLREVVDELRTRGANYERTDLTRQMQKLTQLGELKRKRMEPSDGGRPVWHYRKK